MRTPLSSPVLSGARCDLGHRAPDRAVEDGGIRAGQGERHVGAEEPRGGRRQDGDRPGRGHRAPYSIFGIYVLITYQ